VVVEHLLAGLVDDPLAGHRAKLLGEFFVPEREGLHDVRVAVDYGQLGCH
jgi:hypothetical protein